MQHGAFQSPWKICLIVNVNKLNSMDSRKAGSHGAGPTHKSVPNAGMSKPSLPLASLHFAGLAMLFALTIPLLHTSLSLYLPFDWFDAHGEVDPARGYFPEGCRWRTVKPKGGPQSFWAVMNYEYWDELNRSWSQVQPSACRIDYVPINSNPIRLSNASSTRYQCSQHYCTYFNLWYTNGRFFAVDDGVTGPGSVQVSHDIHFTQLSVASARDFPSQVDANMVPGSTVLIDFVYYLHPTAIGHWLEHLMPLVSVLRSDDYLLTSPPSRILVFFLKRSHVFEWVRAALAAALGVPAGGHLPPLIFQQEAGSVWDQHAMSLEGIPSTKWVCFERVVVVKDTLSGGGRVALTSADAQTFRRRAYELHNLDPPVEAISKISEGAPLPVNITLLRKSANRRITNSSELIKMLQRFGEVRVLEFFADTPVAEQLSAMRNTTVLVSPHTSGLANSVFLPPGAVVIELIQRNWVWDTLDQSFLAQTKAMGDIHHFAWRATKRGHVEYINPRDAVRFGGNEWAGEKCDTDECTEAHTLVDIVVDISELEALLKDRLPLALAKTSVADAALPWPKH